MWSCFSRSNLNVEQQQISGRSVRVCYTGEDAFNFAFLFRNCAWCWYQSKKKQNRSTTSNASIAEGCKSWTCLLVPITVISLQWRRCVAAPCGSFSRNLLRAKLHETKEKRDPRLLSHCAGSSYHSSFLDYKWSFQFQSQWSTARILFATKKACLILGSDRWSLSARKWIICELRHCRSVLWPPKWDKCNIP